MGDYTRARADWADDAIGATPILGANLDTMEAGIDTAHDEMVEKSVFDAKGDILVASANDAYDNLAVGANNKVLTAASGETLGAIWQFVNGAMIRMGSDAQGDVIYFNGTDFVRLAPGTSGHFLKTQGAAANPTWAAAKSPSLAWALWK